MAACAAKLIPTKVINNFLKEPIKTILPSVESNNYIASLARNVVAGGLGGSVPLLLSYPFGFSNTLVSADVGVNGSRLFKGHNDCIRRVI